MTGGDPEDALAVVQGFMEIVTESALAWCGDVKDYEGDGALMYFESVAEAAQAAFAIRSRLAAATGPLAGIQGRLSLDVGDIVVGIIGSPMRRSVALIGPSINRAARMLKEIPPAGIIATEKVVERLAERGSGARRPLRGAARATRIEGLRARGRLRLRRFDLKRSRRAVRLAMRGLAWADGRFGSTTA